MSYEEQIKEKIKDNISTPPDDFEINESQMDELVEKCVSVDVSWPIYNITATQFDSKSRKPSNISVEFDIESALEILSQAGYLTGDPLGTMASISALCALVGRESKIDLEPETGFVYWVAYENQDDPWEIRKSKLIHLASTKSKSMDVPFDIDEKDVERRIQRLCRIKSFKIEHQAGEEYVILRERCSADWS